MVVQGGKWLLTDCTTGCLTLYDMCTEYAKPWCLLTSENLVC